MQVFFCLRFIFFIKTKIAKMEAGNNRAHPVCDFREKVSLFWLLFPKFELKEKFEGVEPYWEMQY